MGLKNFLHREIYLPLIHFYDLIQDFKRGIKTTENHANLNKIDEGQDDALLLLTICVSQHTHAQWPLLCKHLSLNLATTVGWTPP